MKKLTDQELDSAFKNAAEGYEPAFDQAAWEAMNAKLDQPGPTFWKRWMPFAFLGMMIFSAGVWVGTRLNESAPITPLQTELKSEGLIQEEKSITKSNPDQTQANSNGTANDVVVDEVKRVARYPKREAATNPVIISASVNSENHNEISNAIKLADNSNPIDEVTFILPKETNTIVADNLIADGLVDSTQNEISAVKKDSTQSYAAEEKKKKALTDSHSFYVRLLASPDFSSIDNTAATTSGSNYAVLVDYQLTNRWSISTGGIWSMKKYSSDKETTYGKYTADRMVGDCRVLDIPLNIYYRFLPQSKVSFYTGLGLSSYVMLQEDYTYTFDSPTGSRDFSYYIEKQNNEWFKVLNVSLGVQYRIAQRFQLQIEPFLKAPLSGIGEWNVKLSSMGVFMGLKYKIN